LKSSEWTFTSFSHLHKSCTVAVDGGSFPSCVNPVLSPKAVLHSMCESFRTFQWDSMSIRWSRRHSDGVGVTESVQCHREKIWVEGQNEAAGTMTATTIGWTITHSTRPLSRSQNKQIGLAQFEKFLISQKKREIVQVQKGTTGINWKRTFSIAHFEPRFCWKVHPIPVSTFTEKPKVVKISQLNSLSNLLMTDTFIFLELRP
jgi:hypothetical protein